MRALLARTWRSAHTHWHRTLKVAVLGGSSVALLSGCVAHPLQNSLDAKGEYARLENSLFFPVFWIAVGVFCLIFGLVTYVVIRFRARSDDEAPRQVHGHTKAELTWTILPALLLASIAVPTVKFVFDLNKFPSNAMTIDVTGHRWWWQATYTNQTNPTQVLFNTATEIHIPVKTKVIIDLSSVDVIHNFWVPELAGKLYAIPGRHNKMVLESDDVGTFYGQCSEFCGTSHANMRLRVIVDSPDQFTQWMANQEAQPNLPVAAATSGSSTTPTGSTSSSAAATSGAAAASEGGASAASGGASASPPSGTETSTSTTSTSDLVTAGFNDFKTIGCAGCHTIQGISSGVVGPDLTHFKSRDTFAGSIFQNTDANLRLWLANPPAEKPGSVMPNLNLSNTQISQLIAFLDTLK
ncbi:MAG: cytochrome c oxidase subunit II [Acidimicrobiales bacterium]